MKKTIQKFILIVLLTIVATVVALPKELPIEFSAFGRDVSYTIGSPDIDFTLFGTQYKKEFELKPEPTAPLRYRRPKTN